MAQTLLFHGARCTTPSCHCSRPLLGFREPFVTWVQDGRTPRPTDARHRRDLRATIRFEDVRGSHWERDFGGRLKIVRPGDTRTHGDALDGLR
jgi:hypothetical protein